MFASCKVCFCSADTPNCTLLKASAAGISGPDQKLSLLVEGTFGSKSVGTGALEGPGCGSSLVAGAVVLGAGEGAGVVEGVGVQGGGAVERAGVEGLGADSGASGVTAQLPCVRTRNLSFDIDTFIPPSRDGPSFPVSSSSNVMRSDMLMPPWRDGLSFGGSISKVMRSEICCLVVEFCGRLVSAAVSPVECCEPLVSPSPSRKVVFGVRVMFTSGCSLSESELEAMKSRRRLPVNTCTGTRALSSRSEFDRIFIDMFVIRFSSLVPESLSMSRIRSRLSLIVWASPSGSLRSVLCVKELVEVCVEDVPEVDGPGAGSGGGGGMEGGGSVGRGGGM